MRRILTRSLAIVNTVISGNYYTTAIYHALKDVDGNFTCVYNENIYSVRNLKIISCRAGIIFSQSENIDQNSH